MRFAPLAIALVLASPAAIRPAMAQSADDAVAGVCLAEGVQPEICACASEFIGWLAPTNPAFLPYEAYEAMLSASREVAEAGGEEAAQDAAEQAVVAAHWPDLGASDLAGVARNARAMHRGAITGCEGPEVALRW